MNRLTGVEGKLACLDVFSGIGGFALGLERTGGFETVAFCEIEPYCRAVLAKRWPHVPCYTDVRELNADRLARDGINIDFVCGGFPCQDISLAGDGAGLVGTRSGLWGELFRLIQELSPQGALIENVSALRSRGLDIVLRQLASIGYDAEWYCIPACAVGAPHQRDRIWIFAYPHVAGQQQHGEPDSHAAQPRLEASLRYDISRLRTAVADGDADVENTERDRRVSVVQSIDGGTLGEGPAVEAQHASFSGRRGWWEAEPDVGRVANGIPARTHRLRALGNAVVPQIPEILGRAILRSMQ